VETPKGSCFFVVTAEEVPSDEEIAAMIARRRPAALRAEEMKFVREWSRDLHRRAEMLDYMSESSASE
jgi:hypothetical protein